MPAPLQGGGLRPGGDPIRATLSKQATKPMTSSVFPDLLLNCADCNGTIRFSVARQAAEDHNLWEEFRSDYPTLAQRGGIDAHEFLEWLGY